MLTCEMFTPFCVCVCVWWMCVYRCRSAQDPNNRRIVSVVVDQSWVKGSLKIQRAEAKKKKKLSKEAVLAKAKAAAEAVAKSDLMNPANEKRYAAPMVVWGLGGSPI